MVRRVRDLGQLRCGDKNSLIIYNSSRFFVYKDLFYKKMYWAFLASTLVTSFFLAWFLIDLFYADTPDLPGTQEIANITNLGFGPDRKLLVVDFDVSTIDLSDKKWARMEVYQTIGNTVTSTFYPVGIEVKGSGVNERPKLNYAIEIWEAADASIPCTSIATCDDDKANLFDMFTDDFEDWVMRGGYKEPTLLRDAIPSNMEGGILEHTLVELVFRNDGKYYYEGVYLLYPAIQRKVLEKRLNWPTKGKKTDCEDNPTDTEILETAIIGEYTNPGLGSRKTACNAVNDMIKFRYPKCDDAVPCYVDHMKSIFDVLTMTNTSVVDVDLNSFAINFLAESMMLNGDYPIASQYFYKHPVTQTLHAGPRWDYDYLSWRFAETKGWGVEANYGSTHMPLWVHLGQNAEFINLVNNMRNITTTTNLNIAKAIINERRGQFQAGYFDRNIARWNGFGNRVVAYTKDFNLVNHRVKDTWKEEIDFIEDIFEKRAAWMLANPVEPFEFKHDHFFVVRTLFTMIPFVMFFLALLVWTVVLVYYLIDVCKCDCGCDCSGEEADEEEGIRLVDGAGASKEEPLRF